MQVKSRHSHIKTLVSYLSLQYSTYNNSITNFLFDLPVAVSLKLVNIKACLFLSFKPEKFTVVVVG